ncbi:MAG: 2-oxoglutarate dehydrogenase E1 component, partial [Gemmatimonadota bacterium]|nr:2-oxoglutarate dehydrogenase E1 component [Gemmatimonadota bacterium]
SQLLQAFREHGHQAAKIDPLGSEPPGHPQLDPAYWGTSMEALEAIPSSVIFPGAGEVPLALTLDRLKATYSGAIGYEFEHLEDPERVEWLWEQVEGGTHFSTFNDDSRRQLLQRLTQVEGMEQFIHRAYLGQKRFSIEGTDMMVPMLDEALELAAAAGATEVVIGMAHRGRLNVLAHIVGVPYDEIVGEFEGRAAPGGALYVPDPGTGDVKYHHGAQGTHALRSGGTIRVSLAPNPSHLEYVNPVVLGMTRARQLGTDPTSKEQALNRVVPILIHGDAAFAAEGVVAETLNLARLRGYDVGGTIHIIANNQVGFTTDPGDGRSTGYASDLAKGYDIPIVHVNADQAESCLAAVHLAMAYRKQFNDDMVIDLVGYRRHGHNEGDEPSYTQPTLYAKIGAHPTVRALWADRMAYHNVASEEEATALVEENLEALREAQARIQAANGHGNGDEPNGNGEEEIDPRTAVSYDRIVRLNEALLDFEPGFTVHPKLLRQLERRNVDFGPDYGLAWGHAEALAFATLLEDGVPVRLSGQDSQRGTFSHRHLVLHDAHTGATITPVARVSDTRFEVYNSPLTEAAVIGFEYGFAVARDRDLVMWEAQFGDFVNVAQVMIDQFISAGWSKWAQRSRLTLLLPHGYEGQGPEHSSARLERFLQLCAEDNMRVVYPTTPAQYFHLLRRQALSEPERPLIVMTPKSLLRHPMATSPVRDLTDGKFESVIDDDSIADPDAVRRLILCSGKIYYDLVGSDLRKESPGVAVARVEALYPFPEVDIQTVAGSYPNLEEIIWTQEEPGNMGGLSYVGPRLRAAISRKIRLRYVARPERASPAEGHAADHTREQARLVEESLTG